MADSLPFDLKHARRPIHRLKTAGRAYDRSPDNFDQVTQDHTTEPEADFIPLHHPSEDTRQHPQELDPYQYDSLRAEEAFNIAVSMEEAGQEEDAVQQYIRASKIAETAREWHLSAVACERVGNFLATPSEPYDLERAFRMYRRAIASYEQCGLFAEARELAYKQMCMKLHRGKELSLPWVHRLELMFQWVTAGFGFRPLRVIGVVFCIVLIYAMIYWLADGIQRPGYPGQMPFVKCLYFSGITFATVGFGDFVPKEHTRLLALSEGFVGAFMMGYFVAVLANRLSRA